MVANRAVGHVRRDARIFEAGQMDRPDAICRLYDKVGVHRGGSAEIGSDVSGRGGNPGLSV